ncbi:hypothetical protein R3P38DRAFT_2780587 [Favolaschia claudopus]|uniref:Uncharacterized protein n=1 Tax=Favolaschia claudopus TaxID=2862362 RepID=A0AAW0B9J6_9AGAR
MWWGFYSTRQDLAPDVQTEVDQEVGSPHSRFQKRRGLSWSKVDRRRRTFLVGGEETRKQFAFLEESEHGTDEIRRLPRDKRRERKFLCDQKAEKGSLFSWPEPEVMQEIQEWMVAKRNVKYLNAKCHQKVIEEDSVQKPGDPSERKTFECVYPANKTAMLKASGLDKRLNSVKLWSGRPICVVDDEVQQPDEEEGGREQGGKEAYASLRHFFGIRLSRSCQHLVRRSSCPVTAPWTSSPRFKFGNSKRSWVLAYDVQQPGLGILLTAQRHGTHGSRYLAAPTLVSASLITVISQTVESCRLGIVSR